MTPDQLKRAEELAKANGNLILQPPHQVSGIVLPQGCQLRDEDAAKLGLPPAQKVSPTQPIPDSLKDLVPKREAHMLEFFAYETMGMTPIDFAGDVKKLSSDDDCQQYIHNQGKPYQPSFSGSGSNVVEILQQLKGMPLCNAVLAHVHGFHPSYIRITSGYCTSDVIGDRVTIFYEEREGKKYVTRIEQEMACGYTCGADVNVITKAIQEGRQPVQPGNVYGNTKGLDKVDFS